MRKINKFIYNIIVCISVILNIFMIDECFGDINFKFTNTSTIDNDISLNNNHSISSNFRKIRLDMNIDEVKSLVGEPDRIDLSSYGFNWYVYNNYKNTFFMIGIDNNKVVGIYSNTDNNIHLNEIKIDETGINYIRNNFKVEERQNDEKEYDVLKMIGYNITLFYDIHKDYTVTSFEIIKNKYLIKRAYNFYFSKDIEKSELYTDKLEKSLEMQMFDLINSTREKFGLKKLEYDNNNAHTSAKKHALDMKKQDYFAHNSLNGETPFDRMKKEGIQYSYAGENLACGHINAIKAHHALMNSKGHRDIILTEEFKNVGIGIEFGGNYLSYYVQNYYA